MYITQCHAGYPIPAKEGKFEVYMVRATISNPAADARLTLFDDSTLKEFAKSGKCYAETMEKPNTLIDLRSSGEGTGGNLEVVFPEPIKTRYGISICGATNLVGGSAMMYVR